MADPAFRPAADTGPAWTAGRYLKARRQAQGVAGLAVALAMANRAGSLEAGARHADAEEDRIILARAELVALQEDFRFSIAVYETLAEGLPPLTILCRGCACSAYDACAPTCAWVVGDPGLCTACERAGHGRAGG